MTPIEKKKLKKKLDNKCVFCGCTNKLLLTIDHKVPTTRVRTNDESNLQVACWFCNQLKGALKNDEFRQYYNVGKLCKLCAI